MYSIIIPAYNEGQRIKKTVEHLEEFFKKKEHELIISADGCTDDTVQIGKSLAKSNHRVRIIFSEKRKGKGGGLLSGFRASKGEIAVFADADESSSPKDIWKLIGALKHADVAIGSRSLKSSVILTPQPLIRRILGVSLRNIVKALFKLEIEDTQCGYKAFRRDALEKTFGKVRHLGFEFDIELLLRLKKERYKIVEVPIIWENKGNSKLKAYDIIKMIFSISKLKVQTLISSFNQ